MMHQIRISKAQKLMPIKICQTKTWAQEGTCLISIPKRTSCYKTLWLIFRSAQETKIEITISREDLIKHRMIIHRFSEIDLAIRTWQTMARVSQCAQTWRLNGKPRYQTFSNSTKKESMTWTRLLPKPILRAVILYLRNRRKSKSMKEPLTKVFTKIPTNSWATTQSIRWSKCRIKELQELCWRTLSIKISSTLLEPTLPQTTRIHTDPRSFVTFKTINNWFRINTKKIRIMTALNWMV